MEQKSTLSFDSLCSALMFKRMLLGAAIGLLVILNFVIPGWEGKPEWGPLWQFRPLVVTPFAGAMGGLFFHVMGIMRQYGGWRKVIANVISALVFVVGIWMGIVLGLVGTMWH